MVDESTNTVSSERPPMVDREDGTGGTPVLRFSRHVPTVVVIGAIVTVVLLLFFFNPATTWFYPKCVFHEMTGLYCPGCGSTRALSHLLHGELVAALHANALVIVALLVAGVMALRHTLRRQPPATRQRIRPVWIVILLAVIATFGVLRNVPRPPFSWLAPPAEAASGPK